jgi:hypothetical protein
MNRDDIIRMARECGYWSGQTVEMNDVGLERFAALVAAAEREECAKVADSICDDKWALYLGRPPYTGKEPERASDYMQGKAEGAGYCAEAIRARGEK